MERNPEPHHHGHHHGHSHDSRPGTATAVLITAALLTAAMYFIPVTGIPRLAAFLTIYLIAGHTTLHDAAEEIAEGTVFNEHMMVVIATAGVFILSALEGSYDCYEAIAVMIFFRIGQILEEYSADRSVRDISGLMKLRPEYANVKNGGDLKRVTPESVLPGDVITVLPGERVPLDGTVVNGISAVDTSALTGESLPKDIGPGDAVYGGCINCNGVVDIRVTAGYGNSTVKRILELAGQAGGKRSEAESFISKFAGIYTPAVCCGALLLSTVPPAARILSGLTPEWSTWIYRALTFLLISCPCALVISIPASFVAAIGGAARRGILIKGAEYVETLSRLKAVVFDKTGTLTKGVFNVKEIHGIGISDVALLEYAAKAEYFSSHPIAESLKRAYGKSVDSTQVGSIKEIAGMGVCAEIDGKQICAGNSKLMCSIGTEHPAVGGADTVVHISIDGVYAGYIVIGDSVKPESAESIAQLHSCGIGKVAMLTGDNETGAQAVAEAVGINCVYSGLLPADKAAIIERIMDESNGCTAFIGDGINDAPVLCRADVGIAMGAIGSDAAIESADVVLMDDNPIKAAEAVRISHKCMRIVRQNTIFTITSKAACLLAGAFGLAGLWIAVLADVGIMLLAVLNASRAMSINKI